MTVVEVLASPWFAVLGAAIAGVWFALGFLVAREVYERPDQAPPS